MRLRAIAFVLMIGGVVLIGVASLPALAVSGFLDQPPDGTHPWDQQLRDNTRSLMDQGR